MGLSVPAFQRVPCQSEPLGKPRLTLVSDGNPLRRLLLRSKKNSVPMAVSPWMDLPVTSRGETACLMLSHQKVLVDGPVPELVRSVSWRNIPISLKIPVTGILSAIAWFRQQCRQRAAARLQAHRWGN